ncbi:hypothetical protein Ancab_014702 [Ancistrocladus abbreviatus]
MNMDPRLLRQYYEGDLANGTRFDNESGPALSRHDLVNGFPGFRSVFSDFNYGGFNPATPDPVLGNLASTVGVSHEEDWHEDDDFSDEVLRYINQILMEEDVEDKGCMLQESLELQAKEKSFYEAIGKEYPPSPNRNPNYVSQNLEFTSSRFYENYERNVNGNGNARSLWVDPSCSNGFGEYSSSKLETLPVYQTSQSSYSSSNSINSVVDGLVESPVSTHQIPDLYNGIQSVSQFIKGVEEASKFIPNCSELIASAQANMLPKDVEGQHHERAVKLEKKDEDEEASRWSRGRKHSNEHSSDMDEERSRKQAAIYPDSTVRSAMFDMVLLCHGGDKNSKKNSLQDSLQNAASRKTQQNSQGKGSSGGKGRGKKQSGKKEMVDLRTLLINCSQAVAVDDRRTAYELLKQIRQHCSPYGEGNQRLAHCCADGLEARLAGTGSQIYKGLISKRTSTADILKAYHLYLAACPFRKLSNFFSNRTITKLTENATRIHIIDFGILYGFQWPNFIQRQSKRPHGPPMVRITGIDFPQPGFRPAERIEETGRRLANYAQSFNVPFEYNAIAKRWETVQVEDLKLEKDEVLVVNCIYRMKNLPDETLVAESSRNIVLNLIRKINPDVFIHGIVNGAYNAPFFVTRFREALFYFSSHFDILETIVPREWEERMVLERDILGREALNVIACEGWERVERPETYKQWQVRNMKAGFMQLPLDPEIKNRAIERVRLSYHKDFLIDEDGKWLLQGWKGRTIYALSTWKPV